MQTNPTPYILFFRNSGPENYQHLSPDQRQELMMRWNTWYDRLVREGKAVEGQPLELETRVVSGTRGERVMDGPFAEAKESLIGYWVLDVEHEARIIEFAGQIAAYSNKVEVRQVMDAPPDV